jgi:hypothetical protein
VPSDRMSEVSGVGLGSRCTVKLSVGIESGFARRPSARSQRQLSVDRRLGRTKHIGGKRPSCREPSTGVAGLSRGVRRIITRSLARPHELRQLDAKVAS